MVECWMVGKVGAYSRLANGRIGGIKLQDV
jgi:hypothetical protein